MALTGMITSAGLGLGGFLAAEVEGSLIAVAMAVTFAIQLGGLAIGWSRPPSGAVRGAVCGAFLVVGVANLGLLGALWSTDVGQLLSPLYLGNLVFLLLQGYHCLWRGRA
ncbi:hypothetical protein ACTD5D_35755 [Nocardia takedensis]|uniref:hypothetical protein n=1 Tax=Nocardia takedensis TaxID=259390 RepID=UPI00031EE32D|nr:hypothetical protein [Nocardia takedensis]